uniref:Uncharacterized protein n=1 Tax=Labrus bergylta TaxID=56723 RepID=A0A3Q3NQX1_9LABR
MGYITTHWTLFFFLYMHSVTPTLHLLYILCFLFITFFNSILYIHLWDQLARAVHARVTNTATLVDLQQLLVEEWDAIPQQNVTRLVTSMKRRCQAVGCVWTFHTLLRS